MGLYNTPQTITSSLGPSWWFRPWRAAPILASYSVSSRALLPSWEPLEARPVKLIPLWKGTSTFSVAEAYPTDTAPRSYGNNTMSSATVIHRCTLHR